MTNTQKNQGLWGRAALFAAALIWGSSFFVMKSAVSTIPTFMLLGIRFTVGAVLLALLFWKRLKRVHAATVRKGALLGVLLASAYAVQTFGLVRTTPGKNAFLTAVYCVLVPFFDWLLTKKAPQKREWAAGVLCVAGIGLTSLDGGLSMGLGDVLTLCGGVIYAWHMLAVNRFTAAKAGEQEEDAVMLTMVQFASAAVVSWAASLLTETAPASIPVGAWGELLYLSVFATTVALLLQTLGQKVTPAAPASILLSLESVFGVVFSVMFYGETVTLRLALGFALIFAAVVFSVTGGTEALDGTERSMISKTQKG